MQVSRIEWMPVVAEYSIPASSREEAIAKLRAFDDGELTHSEIDGIADSRTVTKRDFSAETVRDIDEESYWKTDGKTAYDIEEEKNDKS